MLPQSVHWNRNDKKVLLTFFLMLLDLQKCMDRVNNVVTVCALELKRRKKHVFSDAFGVMKMHQQS